MIRADRDGAARKHCHKKGQKSQKVFCLKVPLTSCRQTWIDFDEQIFKRMVCFHVLPHLNLSPMRGLSLRRRMGFENRG
jgi:hypothetical protein